MKKPLAIIKISDLIFAGDMFESRSVQRQSVLLALEEILDLIHKGGLRLYKFPGNHDKTVYSSHNSFLEVYKHHPCVEFNNDLKKIMIKGVDITLLPFWSDDVLIPKLKEAEGGDVLISHFEMKGSTNLGHTNEKSSITRTLLKKWKKVYLGHFHNTHEINKNIIHLPSFQQTNFGEDPHKGFTVLHDDLSYHIVRGHFKRFNKISIDINKTDSKSLLELIRIHSGSQDTIRFEFTGDKEKLDAIDKNLFKDSGIDVKKNYDKIYEINETEKPELIKKYDKEQVHTSFKKFCEDKNYDYEIGIIFLDNFLKENNG